MKPKGPGKPDFKPPHLQDATPATPEEIARAKAAAKAEGRVFGVSGLGDWLGEKPVIDEASIVETIRRDVVVIGGGHAGLLATLGAVDEGATVAVIETQPEERFLKPQGKGPAGWYGGDIGHVNSKWLISQGFGPYNTGEIAYEFCKRSAGHCDPELIKLFVQNSGPMVDRMMEIYDASKERRLKEDGEIFVGVDILGRHDVTVDYTEMTQYPQAIVHHQHEGTEYPVVRAGFKSWPCNIQFYGHQGNEISVFNKYIMYYTQEHGASWYYEHRAVVLEQNDAGDVTGVIVEDISAPGQYKRFVADRGVVVAAGDFKGNADMCRALLNETMEWSERNGMDENFWRFRSTRDGTGHRMMCWAGAVMETTPRPANNGKFAAMGPWGTVPFVQLNAFGKRFYNEAAVPCYTGAINCQPEGRACYVADSRLWDIVEKSSLDHGAPNFGLDTMVETCKKSFDALEIGNPAGGPVTGMNLPGGNRFPTTVFAAESLDQLADFLGYKGEDKDSFLREIEHYNEMCYAGKGDTDFGRDDDLMIPIDKAPYYGGTADFTTKPMLGLVTLAGVIADGKLRVLRDGNRRDPIKGLYTCGNCLGNRYGLEYASPMAGNSIGMAMTHGWLAGQNAAHGV